MDDDEIFVFETAQSRIQVPMRDIYYFATAVTPHKVMLITKNRAFGVLCQSWRYYFGK